MDFVFICPRGHRDAVEPTKVRARVRCAKCNKEIELLPPGDEHAGATWLIVGRTGELPHTATPLPFGKTLRLGAVNNLWLHLDGDGVEDLHAELHLQAAQRVQVKHLADDGRTWIDKAAIFEGILGPDNELRIGENSMRIGSTTLVQRLAKADSAQIIVEDGDEPSYALSRSGDDDPERPPKRQRTSRFEGWTAGLKLRAVGCVVLILASLGYLGWVFLFPSASSEMPGDTAYTCPEDGTQFRGNWEDGPPKCPQCGALCFGSVRYDVAPHPTPADPATQPAEPANESVAPNATTTEGQTP